MPPRIIPAEQEPFTKIVDLQNDLSFTPPGDYSGVSALIVWGIRALRDRLGTQYFVPYADATLQAILRRLAGQRVVIEGIRKNGHQLILGVKDSIYTPQAEKIIQPRKSPKRKRNSAKEVTRKPALQQVETPHERDEWEIQGTYSYSGLMHVIEDALDEKEKNNHLFRVNMQEGQAAQTRVVNQIKAGHPPRALRSILLGTHKFNKPTKGRISFYPTKNDVLHVPCTTQPDLNFSQTRYKNGEPHDFIHLVDIKHANFYWSYLLQAYIAYKVFYEGKKRPMHLRYFLYSEKHGELREVDLEKLTKEGNPFGRLCAAALAHLNTTGYGAGANLPLFNLSAQQFDWSIIFPKRDQQEIIKELVEDIKLTWISYLKPDSGGRSRALCL
jgi:hypothetical protein